MEFKEKIKLFRTLHDQNNPLMLPNAWDASSAKIFERNDFQAIGTTSAGIAATLGYPDGEKIPLELMLNSISNISKNTKLPVSADIEGGYAANIFDLRKILNELEKFEVVGINIEDGRGTYLREINEQKVILDFIKAYS
ncbi:isocitrate lyase/phosphoenolpyruvate mutase family protein, partial [Bacillus thuringiensis]|nr:isocitrate lyase/phosphoenolpyruvate mutase family protein [Bacillus thuringiensis]